MRYTFSLTPTQSRRLIARGTAAHPAVTTAMASGTVVIAYGTTNAFVAEELTGKTLPTKLSYTAGLITRDGLTQSPVDGRIQPIVIRCGTPVAESWTDVVPTLGAGDVFIKGANAIDPAGLVGVLLSSDTGGTIGAVIGSLSARGIPIVVPVGLEKLVPSVRVAAAAIGTTTVRRSTGHRVGMMVLANTQLVTELESCSLLFGVNCAHVASGGMLGGEGSVVLCAQGEQEAIERLAELIDQVRSQPEPEW